MDPKLADEWVAGHTLHLAVLDAFKRRVRAFRSERDLGTRRVEAKAFYRGARRFLADDMATKRVRP